MNRFLFFFLFLTWNIFSYTKEDVHQLKLDVSTHLPFLHGWCSHEKAMDFVDLVLEIKPKLCVELGVFAGKSVYPIASTLKLLGEGKVVAVDPWDRFECIRYFDPEKDKDNLEWWGKIYIEFVHGAYCYALKHFHLEDHVETLRLTSEKAASEIDGEIDILHIDGNHSERVSLLDVQLYLPKVRSGGYIYLTDALWKERADGVDLLLESCDVLKHIDGSNCIVFKKR